jgi:PKD repeat protein
MPPLRLASHFVLSAPGLISACLATLLLAFGAAPAFALEDEDSGPLPMTPVIGIAPDEINFSRCLDPNIECEERTFELFNAVDDPSSVLEVTGLLITGSDYSLLGPQPPLSIPGDGTRISYTVRFCPQTGNPVIGAVTISAPAASNSPRLISFTGDANYPPVCDPGGPYETTLGHVTNFDGSDSEDPDPEGEIVSYRWDFGDGSTGTGAMTSHLYLTTGVFTVLLSTLDDCGAIGNCTTTATVTRVNLPPICDAGGPYSAEIGELIQFDPSGSSDPDGTIVFYRWQFGDGGTSTQVAPQHGYVLPGTYVVTLFVRDDDGASTTCTTTATVTDNDVPVCDAGGPYLAVVGAGVHFDGTGSFDPDGTIVDYQWTFGDGATGTGPTPVHAYAAAGDYTVELCVEDNAGGDACCTTTAHVIASGTPLTPVIGVNPGTLDFGDCNAQGVPVVRTLDVFNDVADPSSVLHLTSAIVTGANFTLSAGPNLPIDLPGDGTRTTFTVRFTPPGPNPVLGELELTAPNAFNSPLDVSLRGRANATPICDAGGPYSGAAGEGIQFDGSGSSDPGGITLGYRWEFGDGNTSTLVSPLHSYANPGTYNVILALTDNCGVRVECTTSAAIFANPVCDAGGSYAGIPGLPVQFDGTGSHDPDGFIVSYAWSFGDGGSGSGPTPTHTYTQQGFFTVTLTVTDNDQHASTCTTEAVIGMASPVEIASFQAVAHPRAVEVSWRFLASGDFLGFELWRRTTKSDPELKLHDGLLTDDDQNGAIRFADSRVEPGTSYDYRLVAMDRGGEQVRAGSLHVDVPMPELGLRIAPNPSRPPIQVAVDLPQAGPVKVWVADATGRIVRTLLDGPRPAGTHPLPWDGRDERGIAVASGIYFTILEGANDIQRQKLVLVR